MKKIYYALAILLSIMFLGVTQGQSLVSIGSDATMNTISNAMPKDQCLEPGNIIVSKDKHFYFGDTYTTRDVVPKRGNGYDTIILSKSNVLVYNQSLFGFTSPIKWKSNGIPNSATVDSMLVSEGTFKVSSKSNGQLVYSIHRAALANQGNTNFSLSYIGRPDIQNYTANLTNKTFYDKAGRVVYGYECVNYFVHYCGDGKKDTQTSIASLAGGVSDSIAAEECDGTDGVTQGYKCNSECKLVTADKPTCTLILSPTNIVSGGSTTLSWNIIGTADFPTSIIANPVLPSFPHSVSTNVGSKTFPVNKVGTYDFSMTVKNINGEYTCNTAIDLTVNPETPTCTLTLDKTNIVSGENVTLSWNIIGTADFPTSIIANPVLPSFPHSVSTNVGSKTFPVNKVGTYDFSMTVKNINGQYTCNTAIDLTVNPETPTCTLTLDKTNIVSGENVTLSWNIIGTADFPTSIIANPVLPSFPHSVSTNVGSKTFPVNKVGTYDFSMTVKNINGEYTCNTAIDLNVTDKKKVDLSLTKTVNKSIVTSGEDVIFTVTLRNDGQENATNVEVTDLLPNGYIYLSNTVSQGSYNPTNGLRTVGTVNTGTSKTLTLTTKVKNTGNYLNIAEVTKCTEEDIDSTPNNHVPTEDDQASASVTLTQITTEIDIEKILVNNVIYYSGDLVTFRMDFTNKGPSVAHNVIITDYLPASLVYVDSRIFMNNPNIVPLFEKTIEQNVDTIKYRGFNLNVGEGGYIILTGKFKGYERSNQTINNVFIKSDEDEDNASAKFNVYTPTTILTIDKTINKSIFNLGEIVNFTIAVKNNGPTTISGLQIQDIWPDTNCILPSSTRSSNMALTMTSPNNPYTWIYNQTFNIGETIYIYLSGQVKNDVNCVKNYLNTGTLTYTILGEQKFLRNNVPFSVVNNVTQVQCKSISTSKDIIRLDDDNKGSTTVKCETNGQTGNIQIDCGNGEKYSSNNATSFEVVCNYEEDDYPKTFDISCTVNNSGNNNCNTDILVDKDEPGGYCGNGKLDSFESCDITSAKRAYDGGKKHNGYYIIGDRADNGHKEISSKYDGGKYYCKNCGIKELPGEEAYTPVACFNTQTTISVQKGEYLPFRRNLEDIDNIIDGDECDEGDDGKILKDSLKCNFKIYNGKNSDANEDEIYKITKDCDIDERDNNKLFDYFENSNIYRSLDDAFGKYYLKVNDFAKNNVYGEYKLALDSVTYEYCSNEDEKKGATVERVCEVDFAVTKAYIAQKSAFSLTPKATNLKLEGFYDIFGKELINKTDLKQIMILDEGKYNATKDVYKLMSGFIKKYEKLAIKIDNSLVSNLIESNSTVQVSKVPNQQIYIFKGNGELRLKELGNVSKPFTMIIKGLNLVVKGEIAKTNGMFLVDGGTISFEESTANRCKKTQTVQGIFVTNKGFISKDSNIYQSTANDDLDNPRCVYGGLKVKGVLIGNNIESIILARRSQLNHRFQVNSLNENSIKIERRNEIFNGASTLIEYSPSLWEQLPPGANEFTKSLEIYKK